MLFSIRPVQHTMNDQQRLLTTMASELPTIIRQLQSSDLELQSAAMLRLGNFAEMTERWRRVRRVSRRGVLQAAPRGGNPLGATFVAMSLQRDD